MQLHHDIICIFVLFLRFAYIKILFLLPLDVVINESLLSLQDDKDLVHEFVIAEGLTCLIKVGAEADQNYQNYILRGTVVSRFFSIITLQFSGC